MDHPDSPFVEQTPVYNAWNFVCGFRDPGGTGPTINTTVMYNQTLHLFSAPPRISRGVLNLLTPHSITSATSGGPGAIQSFSGTMIGAYWGNTTQAPSTRCIGLAAISDGTSNTALFSERLMGIPSNPVVTVGDKNSAKRALFDVPTSAAVNGGNAAGAMDVLNACKSLPASKTSITSYRSGQIWTIGHPWGTVWNRYFHFGPPNMHSCDTTPSTFSGLGGGQGVVPPTSNHSGGVNVCFTDGSVKFVKDSVSLPTWWSSGNASGGRSDQCGQLLTRQAVRSSPDRSLMQGGVQTDPVRLCLTTSSCSPKFSAVPSFMGVFADVSINCLSAYSGNDMPRPRLWWSKRHSRRGSRKMCSLPRISTRGEVPNRT